LPCARRGGREEGRAETYSDICHTIPHGRHADGHPQMQQWRNKLKPFKWNCLHTKSGSILTFAMRLDVGLASGHPDFRNRPLPVQWRGLPDICHTRECLLSGRFFLRRRAEFAAAIPTNIMVAPRPIGERTCVAIFAVRHARMSANPAVCKLFSLFLRGAILTSFMLRSSAVSKLSTRP
jgi:hypothetical protein